MKRKIVLCVVLIFSLFSTCLYAQAEDDLTLFEIDRLIRKTEYDEALKQLNVYIKNKPENFDNAQSRIKRIMTARRNYSILAERLIDLIQTDPGNNKEIYEITAQLERFEKHPSDQNLQFIADLKKSAEFNYFRAQFLEIQTETAKNTQAGSYIAAIDKAKEGFWLYREDFDEHWEEVPEIYNPVMSLLSDLEVQTAAYAEKNFLPKINDSVNDFVKAVNQEQYDLALTRFTAVEQYMKQYSALRENIVNIAVDMQNKFAEIQKLDEDTTDASFLPFMFRFIYGVESVPDSGILGAVDFQWNVMAGRMNQAVYSVLSKNYLKYTDGVNETYVNTIERYAGLNEKVLDLYKIAETSPYAIKNPYEDYYVRAEYVKNLTAEELKLENLQNRVFAAIETQQKMLSQMEKENLQGQSAFIRLLYDSTTSLGNTISRRSVYELEQYEWCNSYNQLELEDWSALTEKYNENLNSIFVKSHESVLKVWTDITKYYMEATDNFRYVAMDYNQSAQNYIAGFFTKISPEILLEIKNDISKSIIYQERFNADPELDFGINYSYPDIAVSISAFNQKEIENHILTITSYQNQINSKYTEYNSWILDETITALVYRTVDYLEQNKKSLENIRKDSFEQQALAHSKIIAAQLAKNEADIRYREAENALRSEDFTTARKKLQDALTKYDESLGNQNDEVLRADCDEKLQALGERIAKTENEIVVREVRELKNLAKDAYFNGRFDDAEKYLNQAKNRWAVTNVSADEEIVNLMNFVNTAISMKTGREILPSAPQYPEMSQLLNVAYQYFDEGSRKIGEGNKTDGYKDLNLAMESIQKLQYVYPLNQEASILTLRINRLKNPEKFKEEFAQKIETARMMCRSSETRQEGYANLLDYYELDPDYKGLKNLIYQTEIEIGIRQKPVDNSGESRAKKLISEAQSLYRAAGNDVAKLENALEKLDQALAIVSDNRTAINLKDEITTKIGGNTSTVLSTEDERLYQLAIQRLQNNNILGANAIVEQLLKKSSNASSQKIIDLKNKIDARS